MPVGEWEEVRAAAPGGQRPIASFPPATPFSAPGGEGSPGTLGTRQGTPLGGAWTWRCAGWGGSPHPTGNFQANDEPSLRIRS